MRMVGYCRVSTEMQADEGYSLDAQREDITQYCNLYKMELVEMVSDEGRSAKNMDRPGLTKVLSMLRDGEVDGLIVAKLDRLTRSVKDLGHLLDKYFQQSNLISVSEKIDTSSANGRFVLNILISVAQYEREATGERVKRGMAQKKSIGQRCGNIPYGKKLSSDGLHIEDNPDEQNAMYRIKDLRTTGLPLQAIATTLSSEGYLTRSGNPFTLSHLSKLSRM